MKKFFILIALLPFAAHAAKNDDCLAMRDVPADELSLRDVIELGLCRNPQTTSAYLSVKSAQYAKNAGYASYLPQVNASASGNLPYRNQEWGDWSWGASLSASYLIFDFGQRLENLNRLAAVYRATGFEYDETIQNFVYGLIGSYYSLLTANADVETATSLRATAKTALDTANTKYKAGAVARADVLRAETTMASRELDLERAKNNREIVKGQLLAKLSFPANQEIKIADMSATFGTVAENKSIDELIEMAQEQRPDLLRATANKDAAWHRRNSVFLSNLPSISASGTMSWNNTPSESFNVGTDNISGSIGIRASMPLFAGFANMYGVLQAQAGYDQAIENERAARDSATLDIFSAYHNYKTAQMVLKQTETMLKSARESERVTAGMYKVGRATMLDWQTAQAELADAQKQNNAAKYDLFTKRAAVALAIGDIRVGLIKGERRDETTTQ